MGVIPSIFPSGTRDVSNEIHENKRPLDICVFPDTHSNIKAEISDEQDDYPYNFGISNETSSLIQDSLSDVKIENNFSNETSSLIQGSVSDVKIENNGGFSTLDDSYETSFIVKDSVLDVTIEDNNGFSGMDNSNDTSCSIQDLCVQDMSLIETIAGKG